MLSLLSSAFSKNWLLNFCCALAVCCTQVHAATPVDMFADRQLLSDPTGQVTGDNLNATVETKEPSHGGKPPSHSVWVSWVAPSDGIVTFSTEGSSFDTLLSAYTLDPGTKPPMERLREAAQNDNTTRDVTTSLVQFGVTAGVEYEVAVDGLNGATGNIQLSYNFVASNDPPAVILSVPPDHSLQFGDTLTLTVAFQTSKSVHLAWFFNDVEILNSDTPTLVIPNFQPANVGLYRLRITAGAVRMFTNPIEIQINSEGLTATLARNHLFDALNSKLDDRGHDLPAAALPGRLFALSIGVTRGYNGSQIFNTTFADLDPNEPAHCGIVGGASYWLAYVAPASGLAQVDTVGSQFDTVLAIYTHNGPLTGYQDLIPVNCDDNSGPDGRTSSLTFNADAGREYLMVVDGVAGARGIAAINYHLQAAPAGVPPVISQQPLSQEIALGGEVTIEVLASGTAPLAYAWSFQQASMAGQGTSLLSLSNVQLNQAGDYYVVVSNSFGSVQSAVASLSVVTLPSVGGLPSVVTKFSGESFSLSPEVGGLGTKTFQWTRDGLPLSGQASQQLTISSVTPADAGAYVLAISNRAGTQQSSPVALIVLPADPPVITAEPLSQKVLPGSQVTFAAGATSAAPMNYVWKFQDGVIAGQNGSTLFLPTVSATDEGNYVVEISNPFGSVTSTPATLSLFVAPAIGNVPTIAPKLLGGSLSLSPPVTGSTPLTYFWKKNGTLLPGQIGSSLDLPNLQTEDGGSYRLEVSNVAGTAISDPILVQVISPQIAIQSTSNGLVLQLPIEPDMHYRIEANEAFGPDSSWFSVQEGIGKASEMISVTNSLSPGEARFYRVLYP